MLIIHERGRIGLSVSIPLRLEDRIKRTWMGRVGRKSWRAEVGICYKIAWMRIKHEVSLSRTGGRGVDVVQAAVLGRCGRSTSLLGCMRAEEGSSTEDDWCERSERLIPRDAEE